MYICIYVCIQESLYIYMYVCIYVFMYVRVFVCVCGWVGGCGGVRVWGMSTVQGFYIIIYFFQGPDAKAQRASYEE